MKIRKFACQFLLLAVSVSLPGFVMAGSPTDWVQDTVGEVRSVLARRDSGEGPTHKQVRQVSQVLGERFSFHEMARLALDQHWKRLSAKERSEFVHLFRSLLEQSHLWALSGRAGAEQRYVGERLEGNRAVVQALVQADEGEVPVDYFLLANNGSWKIFDLSIDGVRLSHVYRAEFNKVISKESYRGLVQRMSIKLEEVAVEASAPQ